MAASELSLDIRASGFGDSEYVTAYETVDEELKSTAEQLLTLLQLYGKSMTLMVQLNQFRKTFPSKSSVTPLGRFYEAFKENLYSVDSIITRGMQLHKTMVRNPVVKDLREYFPGEPFKYDRTVSGDPVIEFLNPQSIVWSRWTEVQNYQPSQEKRHVEAYTIQPDWAEGQAPPEGSGKWAPYGGQYNYNMIDHGFFVFNYEKAIKKYSYLASILDVDKFEQLFGRSATNGNFQMSAFHVDVRVWTDPDDTNPITVSVMGVGEGNGQGVITTSEGLMGSSLNTYPSPGDSAPDYITPSQFTQVGSMTLYIKNSSGTPQNDVVVYGSDINKKFTHDATNVNNAGVDMFKIRVEQNTQNLDVDIASAGVGSTSPYRVDDQFGGADYMNAEVSYSYLALRNMSLFVNDSSDPSFVSETLLDFVKNRYRMPTFEMRKQLHLDAGALDDAGDSMYDELLHTVEYASLNQYFIPSVIVKDTTKSIFTALKKEFETLEVALNEYFAQARDLCNVDDRTGYFNQFFINGMAKLYPEPHKAPWATTAVFFELIADLIYDQYDGDRTRIYDVAKKTIASIAPGSGTISSLATFVDNFEALREHFRNLDDTDNSWDPSDGMIVFGGSPYSRAPQSNTADAFKPFDAIENDIECRYIPSEVYENYPKWPMEYIQDELDEPPADWRHPCEYLTDIARETGTACTDLAITMDILDDTYTDGDVDLGWEPGDSAGPPNYVNKATDLMRNYCNCMPNQFFKEPTSMTPTHYNKWPCGICGASVKREDDPRGDLYGDIFGPGADGWGSEDTSGEHGAGRSEDGSSTADAVADLEGEDFVP